MAKQTILNQLIVVIQCINTTPNVIWISGDESIVYNTIIAVVKQSLENDFKLLQGVIFSVTAMADFCFYTLFIYLSFYLLMYSFIYLYIYLFIYK